MHMDTQDSLQKDTTLQLLLNFLKENKTGTLEQFQFFAKKFVKNPQDLPFVENSVRYEIQFSINVDFIPNDLQQFIPYLIIVLNQQSTVQLEYKN